MATRKKLDPKTDIPEKRSDIDKNFIVEYTIAHGTPEQRAQMKKIIQENIETRTSKLTNSDYKDIKLKVVRNEFCKMFFPKLAEKKKPKTFFDLVDEL